MWLVGRVDRLHGSTSSPTYRLSNLKELSPSKFRLILKIHLVNSLLIFLTNEAKNYSFRTLLNLKSSIARFPLLLLFYT